MEVKLFDTMSRSIRELKQRSPEIPFGMYCCGPTVYAPAHIGNFRTFLLQDLLRRVLETAGINVKHVRNITDVDDKTIRRSQEEGKTLAEFTQKWTEKFHNDCKELNMLPPHVEPAAVEHIPLQIAMIDALVKNGNAYVSQDSSVYFKVSSDPFYGKLSHLKLDELQTQSTNSNGDANAADEYTRENIADFALWKARKAEDGPNFWKSPWGEGRPGWHIECSAMSTHYLGESFDLHGGGVDLCFPHHENEIAQATCACKNHDSFAQHWFHSAHLMVDGAKMSKSLGNLYTLEDLKKKGFSAMELRYVLISGHYRSQLNFTLKSLEDARSALEKIEKATKKLLEKAEITEEEFSQEIIQNEPTTSWGAFESAWKVLCDDLNTAGALGKIFSTLSELSKMELSKKDAANHICGLAKILNAFGLKLFTKAEAKNVEIPEEIAMLAEQRWAAKLKKDWQEADRLRNLLSEAGWKALDRKDGYSLEKL